MRLGNLLGCMAREISRRELEPITIGACLNHEHGVDRDCAVADAGDQALNGRAMAVDPVADAPRRHAQAQSTEMPSEHAPGAGHPAIHSDLAFTHPHGRRQAQKDRLPGTHMGAYGEGAQWK
jgi:hypothetical protein